MDEEEHNHIQLERNSDGSSKEGAKGEDDEEELEAVELILFHVKECYVYVIPPRKTAASYRADEWNVNKWHWEGALKVVSKGEDCIIRLEDRETGELFARAFLRTGEPNPVEPVIDSSRYFVLRVEENIGGRLRHAFIGVGFRERPQAYDFQAALHDHMKYLNKKQTAEEMEQLYQAKSSVDYSLKEGQTLFLQIKNKGSSGAKSALFERFNKVSLEDKPTVKEGGLTYLKPPPAPPSPISPVERSSLSSPASYSNRTSTSNESEKIQFLVAENPPKDPHAVTDAGPQSTAEDDFGDFQAAG
ncbi:uncharacterized protein At1g03900 [Phalaenopsis equestris]|uniref:uncharacterized protein At1g03900 n=1 Tax=Phalaenopsis equestris TaxID=78828 RepID=UPI0009E38F62|nr:uncharacterized protein At1g03900 [Phalaenopsis equestris]